MTKVAELPACQRCGLRHGLTHPGTLASCFAAMKAHIEGIEALLVESGMTCKALEHERDSALKRVRCFEVAAATLVAYWTNNPESVESAIVYSQLSSLKSVLDANGPHWFSPAKWRETECRFCGEARDERRHG